MAVYPESKKKIVETIIKFSRKNLVGKGEIHPVSEENFGTWRATSKGIERALKGRRKLDAKVCRGGFNDRSRRSRVLRDSVTFHAVHVCSTTLQTEVFWE